MKFTLVFILLCILLTSCTAAPKPELASDDAELPPQDTEAIETAEITVSATETQSVMETTTEPIPVDIPNGEYVYTHETRMNLDDVVISIPHINISPEIDAVVNAYIDSRFTEYIDKYTSIDYRFTINGSLLSLLIYSHEGYSFGGGTMMYTVTVDLDTEMIITLPEILERYGYDYFETTRKYNFTTALPKEAQQVTNSPKADFAIFNFGGEQFYITSENHICLVGTLYRGTILNDPNTSLCVDPLYKFSVLWDIAADQVIGPF